MGFFFEHFFEMFDRLFQLQLMQMEIAKSDFRQYVFWIEHFGGAKQLHCRIFIRLVDRNKSSLKNQDEIFFVFFHLPCNSLPILI